MGQSSDTTIMIVGDDSSFCYLMRRYAERSAHRVVFAYQGEEVLALAQRKQPAVIVLEVGRPGTMGWNVLVELKANQATSDIPVVLCSWQDEGERAVKKGADICLRKPILYEDFLAALADVGICSGS